MPWLCSRQVDLLIAEIAQSSREQSQGIDHVNKAVSHMDKITQGNAANAEETAAAAEELNSQAGVLQETVLNLRRLVEKDRSEGRTPSAPFRDEIPASEPLPLPRRSEQTLQ